MEGLNYASLDKTQELLARMGELFSELHAIGTERETGRL